MKKRKGLLLIFLFSLSVMSMGQALGDVSSHDTHQSVPPVVPIGKPPDKGKPGGSGEYVDWGYLRIGADLARASVGTGVAVVAVLDTGVDIDHPDLAGVIAWCYNAITRKVGCKEVDDKDGHGTHVAGTIAALDNDIGTVGVASGHVMLGIVKVLGPRGGSWDDLAHAIRYAADMGADVISMSLGGDISAYPDIQQMLQDAIDYARSKGVLLVAAAGNEGDCTIGTYQWSWPAANDGVIAVGATGIIENGQFVNKWDGTQEDAMPCFSNEGPYLDIAAPGVYITSLYKGGRTTEMSGTSMATPHVSAVLALLIAKGYSPNQAENRIYATAIDIGYPATMQGAGLIDAAAALA